MSDIKVIELLKPYDSAPLECDGLTRVFHTILVKNRIQHLVRVGRVEWRDRHFNPHFWIELPSGKVVDYRLRMWFGGMAPHGVFDPESAGVTYEGRVANLPVLTDFLFEVLVGKKLEAMVGKIARNIVSVRKGNCYEAAGRYMMDHGMSGGMLLVHGEVRGQGPLGGIRFGHAWIEKGSDVIELANGKHVVFPKGLYCAIGDIRKTFKYTIEEFRKKVLEFENWGPWESESLSWR